jgi:glycosyltransferase involved in cell wall biosynthesis
MKPSGGCPMGFEDWDFWLQCLTAGFKGKHGPALGFRYRKRPESMLANSERERSLIVGYMRAKHKRLYTPRQCKRYEQEEMPRFAIYLADRDELILTSDCHDCTRWQTWTEFARDLRRHQTSPRLQGVPPTVVVTAEPTLHLLQEHGLAANLLWLLEADLEEHQLFVLHVEQQMGVEVRYEVSPPFTPGEADRRDSVLCALPTVLLGECLHADDSDLLASLLKEDDEQHLISRRLRIEHLERPVPLPSDVVARLCATVDRLRPEYRAQPRQRINSRRLLFRTQSDAGLISRRVFGTPAAPPIHMGDGERHIGFVVPLAEFGGVERIVCNMARETKRQGWCPHLFVLGSGRACLLAEFRDTFESIHLIPDEALLQSDRLVSLLGTMDVVVNNQSVFLHAANGDLKRLGVKIISHVQLLDLTADGALCGHPHLALQYEHSLHKVQVPSVDLQTFLLSKGMPPEKVLLVPNAPSFEVPPERLDAALAERARRPAEQPLRILFMARFDRQKGIDRLVHLVRESETLPEITWRIVGKSVLKADGDTSADVELLTKYLHPPALDVYTLSRHYAWADVLVLTSRWEGAPLSILEAQQFGCVPIATNCGAVRELMDDGQTGFLVENADDPAAITDQAIALFTALHLDRGRLIEIGKRAAAVRRAQTWRHTMRELTMCLDAWVPNQGAA